MVAVAAGCVVDCRGRSMREINRALREAVAAGEPSIRVVHPEARHSLAVALLVPVEIRIEGSVGYYCAGMGDGPRITIAGSAGWGLAECIMGGEVICEGSAGNGAAASIRGGRVVIRGDAAARAAISLKGGTVLIGGSTGYMTGFMMQKGTIVVCGDAAEGLGDSMYAGEIYVGGRIAGLGNDAVEQPMTGEDVTRLADLLDGYALPGDARRFHKIVSGGRLHNFNKHEFEMWRAAL
jgi:methylamine---glutamate N-methyltransferase subunit B